MGGVLRLVPEVIKYFNEKADREHEFRMTQLQLQIDSARATQQIDLVHVQGDAAEQAAQMQAYVEAIKGQMQLTGNKFVDGLNMLVRPTMAYYFLTLYGIYKAALLGVALSSGSGLSAAVMACYDDNDKAIFGSMIDFWLVGRVFDSSHKK